LSYFKIIIQFGFILSCYTFNLLIYIISCF